MGHFSCELSCLSHEKMQCYSNVSCCHELILTLAYHVERMITFAKDYKLSVIFLWSKNKLTQRALVAWELALGACAVVRIAANTTNIVIRHIPAPGSDRVPLLDCDLHGCLSLPVAVIRSRMQCGTKTNSAGLEHGRTRRSSRRRLSAIPVLPGSCLTAPHKAWKHNAVIG